MELDNTVLMGGPIGVRTPTTQLRRMGLMGLGEDTGVPGATDGVFPSLNTILTGLNSEALYIINLQRAQQGLPPLSPSQYGPAVNVGIAPETMNVLLLAGAALLGVALLSRRRRR